MSHISDLTELLDFDRPGRGGPGRR